MRRNKIIGVVLALVLVFSTIIYLYRHPAPPSTPKSAIVSLVKPQELYSILDFVRNVEDRWNRLFKHDWVFLSEQNFSEEFVTVISAFVSGKAYFRTINRKQHWSLPNNLDRIKMLNNMRELENYGVPYGGSTSYRQMCRFQAGLFVDYLPEYRYFARIDPDVKLYCDIDEDIFAKMYENQYKLGFTTALRETPHAIHNLSSMANQFMKTHAELIHKNQWLDSFVRPWDEGCHFWSNLEFGDLDFFRSKEFQEWHDFVEKTNGIFYNRWGDAPIHTIAASMFLDISEVHWFASVGSHHSSNVNCPTDLAERLKHRCSCPHDHQLPTAERNQIFTYREQSCIPRLLQLQSKAFQTNWREYADDSVLATYDI